MVASEIYIFRLAFRHYSDGYSNPVLPDLQYENGLKNAIQNLIFLR